MNFVAIYARVYSSPYPVSSDEGKSRSTRAARGRNTLAHIGPPVCPLCSLLLLGFPPPGAAAPSLTGRRDRRGPWPASSQAFFERELGAAPAQDQRACCSQLSRVEAEAQGGWRQAGGGAEQDAGDGCEGGDQPWPRSDGRAVLGREVEEVGGEAARTHICDGGAARH